MRVIIPFMTQVEFKADSRWINLVCVCLINEAHVYNDVYIYVQPLSYTIPSHIHNLYHVLMLSLPIPQT